MRDLEAGQVLDYVVARRRVADRAEADLLAAVVVWVDLHPVTDRDGAASWATSAALVTHHPDNTVDEGVAGVGTPGVGEFAVEELAATLGVSYRSGFDL